MEHVPLAVVHTFDPIWIACVCSSVFVAADVSMVIRSTMMSAAPGSNENTLVDA